ncbi:MAG: GNAT family N-acetyltransferase [Promethearchaeota archaeon]
MIRLILKEELNFAYKLTEIEEWGTSKEELEDLFLFSPQGFFIAESNGIPKGIVSTAFYGSFGVIGNLIVAKRFRGQGLGRNLMDYAINYLKSKGIRTILIDAVPQIISLYYQLGFQPICRSLRLEGNLTSNPVQNVRLMTLKDIDTVIQLDRKHFRGDRGYLLKRRFSLHPNLCHVLIRKDKLSGFIMGIPKENFILVGPWIVNPKETKPQLLLQSLANSVNLNKFRLGILENNKRMVKLTQDLNFTEYFYSIRMIYGKAFTHTNGLFAIAGPDRG